MDASSTLVACTTAAVVAGGWLLFGCCRKSWNAEGKVVVITGASSGIGLETAKLYAKQNAKLVLCARREKELNEAVSLCKAINNSIQCIAVVCDVSIEADCKKLVAAASSINGKIDCLILNAGISMGSLFEDLVSEGDYLDIFRRIMEVNYFGNVILTKEALPFLKNSKEGKIVLVSSLAGKFGTPLRSGYSASKFACHGFFDALRAEVGDKYGIQVTIVCPGAVATNINSSRLGKNPSHLDMDKALPATTAAELLVKGVAQGKREVLYSPGGFANYLHFFFPSLFDKILAREWKKQQKQH